MSGVLVRGDEGTHRDDAVRTQPASAAPARLQPWPQLGRGGGRGAGRLRVWAAGNGERLWFRLQSVALVMQPKQIQAAGPHLRRHPWRREEGPGPTGSILPLVAQNAGVWGRGAHPALELGSP